MIVNNKYKIIKKLGFGTYSIVWKVEEIGTNNFYALKVMSNDYYEIAINEINLLRKLKDKENVIQIIDDFILDNSIYIVIELYEMNLEEYLDVKNIDYEVKIEILKKILIGLKNFEELGIIHGDLKPSNILINKNDRKIAICDLSLSHELGTKIDVKKLQTSYYRSPEIIFGSNYNNNIDLWSLGCIITDIFIGITLFDMYKYFSYEKDSSLPIEINDFNEGMILLNMFEKVLGKIEYEFYWFSLYSDYYLKRNNKKSLQLFYEINCEMKNLNELFEDFIFKHNIKEIVSGLLNYDFTERISINNILKKIDF